MTKRPNVQMSKRPNGESAIGTYCRMPNAECRPSSPCRSVASRRGFNIVELLIALAITATLLTATMVALDASYTAYQKTTRAASTHTISRLTLNRLQTLIRTGVEFGPGPDNPLTTFVHSDVLNVVTGGHQGISIAWHEDEEALFVHRFDAADYDALTFDPFVDTTLSSHVLLEGVVAQFDPNDPDFRIKPFTLEFEKGHILHRATIDLMLEPDDNATLTIEGDEPFVIRLIGSAMPRRTAYGN